MILNAERIDYTKERYRVTLDGVDVSWLCTKFETVVDTSPSLGYAWLFVHDAQGNIVFDKDYAPVTTKVYGRIGWERVAMDAPRSPARGIGDLPPELVSRWGILRRTEAAMNWWDFVTEEEWALFAPCGSWWVYAD